MIPVSHSSKAVAMKDRVRRIIPQLIDPSELLGKLLLQSMINQRPVVVVVEGKVFKAFVRRIDIGNSDPSVRLRASDTPEDV